MCVICVKPKGAQMPSNEIIIAMYRANHDGCGFCTPTKSYKGLSFSTFMRELKKVSVDEPWYDGLGMGGARQRKAFKLSPFL